MRSACTSRPISDDSMVNHIYTNQLNEILREGDLSVLWRKDILRCAREEDEAFTLKKVKSKRLFLEPEFWQERGIFTEVPSNWNEALEEMRALFIIWQQAEKEAKQVVDRFEGFTPQQLIFEWGSYLEFKNTLYKEMGNWKIKHIGLDGNIEQYFRRGEYEFGIIGLDYLLSKVTFHKGTIEESNRGISKDEFPQLMLAIFNHIQVEMLVDLFLWSGMKVSRISESQFRTWFPDSEKVLREERNRLKHQYSMKYGLTFIQTMKVMFGSDLSSIGNPISPFPNFDGYQSGDQSVTVTTENLGSLLDESFWMEYLTSLQHFSGKNVDPNKKSIIHLKNGKQFQIDSFLFVYSILDRLSRVFIQQSDDEIKHEFELLEKENQKCVVFQMETLLAHLVRKNPKNLKTTIFDAQRNSEIQEQLIWRDHILQKHFDYSKGLIQIPADVLIGGIAKVTHIPQSEVLVILSLITANFSHLFRNGEMSIRNQPLMYSSEGKTFYWLPRTMAFQSPGDTLIHLFTKRRDIFKLDDIQSPIFEEDLRHYFRKAGFDVLPEHKFKGKTQGDIDLFAHKDGIFFLGELKITERSGEVGKEQSWKRNKLINRGKKQIPKNKAYLLENWFKIAEEMGIPRVPKPNPDQFFPFLVSNEFLFDRDPELPYMKISILELQILLHPAQEQFLHDSDDYWKLRLKMAREAGLGVPNEFLAWQRGEFKLDQLKEADKWKFAERIQKYVHYLDSEGLPLKAGKDLSGAQLVTYLKENRVWRFMDDLPIRKQKNEYRIGPIKLECEVPMLE